MLTKNVTLFQTCQNTYSRPKPPPLRILGILLLFFFTFQHLAVQDMNKTAKGVYSGLGGASQTVNFYVLTEMPSWVSVVSMNHLSLGQP